MRNLKRVLSLALAVVMVIGMMVMTTGAADFDDAAKIEYTEAVDVMAALGVLEGYNGTYNPDGELTRDQAAKIICYMLMGPKNAVKLEGAGSGKFADTKGLWSEGYVEYCYNMGIIDGYGNGNFGPGDKLLAVQFGKMLLCALGYNAEIEGYGNDNWATNIATDMIAIGLDLEGIDMTANLTREQAAQMAFTALTKTMVTYDGLAAHFGFAEAEPVAETGYNNYDLINDASAGLQFCEKYFPNLKVIEGDSDDFGRPASHKWFVAASKTATGFNALTDSAVHNAAQTASYTYNVTGQNDTTLAAIAAKLDMDTVGVIPAFTAVKGDTVELYFNAAGKIYDAVCLHTELAKIAKVTKTTAADAKYTYDVAVKCETGIVNYTDKTLVGFDFDTMTKDTYITLTKGGATAIAALADSITGKQTAKGTGYTKIDGVQKFYAGDFWTIDAVNYTDTFNFFVDAKGLIIGTEKATSAPAQTSIFYVKDKNFAAGTDFAGKAAQLSVINLDGTSEVLNMAISKAGKVTIRGTEYALGSAGAQVTAGFYTYALNDKGEVAYIAALGRNTAALAATEYIEFVRENAVVDVNNTTEFFATNATELVVIDPTTGAVATITGYEDFKNVKYHVGADSDDETTDVTGVLYTYTGDVLNTVYVLGATVSNSKTMQGWLVEVGDEVQIQGSNFQYVVYNVKGEDTTFLTAKAGSYREYAKIVVTDGVAALYAPDYTVSNAVVEKVTDTYLVIGGVPKYFDKYLYYYDVTDVAKNGVVVDDGVAVGDVITYYTYYGDINTVYTTYHAQEDGVLAENNATYLEDVIGFEADDAAGAAANSDWVVIQYTRPQDMSTGNVLTVKDAEGSTVYTETNSITTAGIGGFMIDPHGYNTNGDLDLEAGTYTYTIACDGVVVNAGSFIVE